MDMWPVLPGPVDQPPGGKDEDGPCAPRLASGRGWGVPSIKEKGESVRVGGNRPSSGRRRSFLRPGPFFSYELLYGFKPASGSEPSHPGIKIMFPAFITSCPPPEARRVPPASCRQRCDCYRDLNKKTWRLFTKSTSLTPWEHQEPTLSSCSKVETEKNIIFAGEGNR